jgi:hypothetical protein
MEDGEVGGFLDLCSKSLPSAPGRIRTRDPLLRRCRTGVQARRSAGQTVWESPAANHAVWHRWCQQPPRCELSAARSFAVVGASQRPIEVPRSRSQSMTLLYSAAVRLQARSVRRRGLSFRFSGGFAGPGSSAQGQFTWPNDIPAPCGVHGDPRVSTAVVSSELAL